VQYLPGELPTRDDDGMIRWRAPENSIGRVHGNHGNALVVVRALTYMLALGGSGLRRVAERSVLNARYLESLVAEHYEIPYDAPCMHEFVASADRLKKDHGVRAMDIAKTLPDYGFHAPTVYFPLVVDEALMLEPTETESPETVEALARALADIAARSASEPDSLHDAPHHTPVSRLDEARAARTPLLTWHMEDSQ
jgi:glycine dehydrogenase subunit 2